MTAFNPQQNEMLTGFAKDLNTAFQNHADKLGDKFIEINTENTERFNAEIRRVTVHGDSLNQNYEIYASKVIQEVRAVEEAAKLRHTQHMREMRIASVVAMYNAGRSIDTAIVMTYEIGNNIDEYEKYEAAQA